MEFFSINAAIEKILIKHKKTNLKYVPYITLYINAHAHM